MIDVSSDGLRATLAALTLRPHAAFDTVGAPDETLGSQVELRFEVTGRGELTDVQLLALRSVLPGRPNGLLPSGYPVGELTKLFCPNPAHATGVRPIFEPAVVGVTGDGEPGRHRATEASTSGWNTRARRRWTASSRRRCWC